MEADETEELKNEEKNHAAQPVVVNGRKVGLGVRIEIGSQNREVPGEILRQEFASLQMSPQVRRRQINLA